MKCKLCLSKKVYRIKDIKSPYIDKEYTLYACKECRSQFFDINQHPVSLNELYENIAEKKVDAEHFKVSKKWEKLKKLVLEIMGKPPETILDVGCSTGNFLMHFSDKIRREGIELSQYNSDIAKKRGLFIYNDYIENITFIKKYDVVSAFAILEHLVSPDKFIQKLQNLVKNGGLLLIMIPSHECLNETMAGFLQYGWYMHRPPEHLNFISKKYLDTKLKSSGFKLKKRYYTTGGVYNPFKNNKIINRISKKAIYLIDNSFANRLPIFDHLYSIYKKET